jgi:hypothetical protein
LDWNFGRHFLLLLTAYIKGKRKGQLIITTLNKAVSCPNCPAVARDNFDHTLAVDCGVTLRQQVYSTETHPEDV